MTQHGRIIKNNCNKTLFEAFIKRLMQTKELVLKNHKPATPEKPQERYAFSCDFEHISIVYETTSNNLIITASDHILKLLSCQFEQIENSRNSVNQKELPIKPKQNILQNQKGIELKSKEQADKKLNAKKKLDELYKHGLKIQKFDSEKFENLLKNIKKIKEMSCRQTHNGDDSKAYLINDAKNKVYMRYLPNQKILQLQGKRSKLFGDIQVVISQISDFETAVSSYIDLTGEEKKAKDLEKSLKKIFPNTFDFLSEQSKIDITIGMMDINNDEVKLSDYSMLLVPLYRGLERLIYDLQKVKNIEVKMIGQAYEKENGIYVLKKGYRRKIKSIVYAEVMSALYSEYFAKRNFYAHSDITGDELSRVITEKSIVKEIFNRFVDILEYNCYKLKEIGVKIDSSSAISYEKSKWRP